MTLISKLLIFIKVLVSETAFTIINNIIFNVYVSHIMCVCVYVEVCNPDHV